jgi:FADH2 O2-dependent halogenase
MKQIVGDRALLIGDAARFVDPIFSTGVSIALKLLALCPQRHYQVSGNRELQPRSLLRVRDNAASRHEELVRLHHRLLSPERSVHRALVADPRYRLDVSSCCKVMSTTMHSRKC